MCIAEARASEEDAECYSGVGVLGEERRRPPAGVGGRPGVAHRRCEEVILHNENGFRLRPHHQHHHHHHHHHHHLHHVVDKSQILVPPSISGARAMPEYLVPHQEPRTHARNCKALQQTLIRGPTAGPQACRRPPNQ